MEPEGLPRRKSYRSPLGRSKISRSQWRNEIELRLSRGESAEAVSRWLSAEGESISSRALRAYRQFVLTPKMLMGQTDYAPAHPYLKERLDALSTLYYAIIIQESRLGLGLKKEVESGELNSVTSAGMKTLLDLLTSTVEIELQLGIRTKQTAKGDDDTLKRLVDGVLRKMDSPT